MCATTYCTQETTVNFELDDDQRMMQTLVERFVADRYGPGKRAAYCAMERGYSPDNWAVLAETGVLALPFPVEDGGLGGGAVEIVTIMEAMGRGMVAEPYLVEILLAGRLLAATGSDEQKAAWIAPLMAGERHLGLAFAEHTSRWSLDRLETRMTTDGIVGAKTFVPGNVDGYIVTALAADGGLGLYLVDANAAGIARRDYRLVDGTVASEVRFEKVAADQLDGGLAVLAGLIDEARLAACAEMIGIAGTAFETTLDYVRQRRQFGVAIGSFQALQHRLADLYAGLEQGRSHLFRAALSNPQDRPAAIAAAKAYISTMSVYLGEECIQFHGGMGVSNDLDIGQGHKRLLLLATLFGDADHDLERYNEIRQAAPCAAVVRRQLEPIHAP
ncbi:MAG: acyl-CoA dehydrogenase [Blastomonas sp.]|nr:acyl-CoA dehydrogenase [Blastomonas sp.]